jgi:hypothetical protein
MSQVERCIEISSSASDYHYKFQIVCGVVEEQYTIIHILWTLSTVPPRY